MARVLHRLLAALVTGLLVWVNFAVHTAPRVGSNEELYMARAQLRFLEGRLHAGLGDEMQKLFPEGSVFTHALYGSAWCSYALRRNTADSVRTHALREARWALTQIERPDVQGRFPVACEPKFGAFYCGWRNSLLASIALLGGRQAEMIALDRYSAELDSAFAKSTSPFIESYSGMAWPADNVVAVASLVMHQRLRPNTHRSTIDRWLRQIGERYDERGMIPHAWDPVADRQQEHARGCSQALINVFLPMIDTTIARGQFDRFRRYFFMERLGVPLVREYPKGVTGRGDVDSGPVILGAGCAASIVGSGACRMNGDVLHAQEFDATVEGFGLALGDRRKRYLLGALPIADLFIVWGRCMPVHGNSGPLPGFLRFHLWSAAGLLLLWSTWWVGVVRRWYGARRAQQDPQ
ncbi:MAG TPA: hypothetical protein PLB89_00320 [Flavobacteriales bacterium]|nr:hypothetical protein [Flavobacteriales bacterium]